MPVQKPVDPVCKYGHGELLYVDEAGVSKTWGLVARDSPVGMRGFFVEVFVCPVCGYTELFDNDPAITATTNRRE